MKRIRGNSEPVEANRYMTEDPAVRDQATERPPRNAAGRPSPAVAAAVAVVAVLALLGVLFAPGGRPAPAHAQPPASTDATLSGLELANATTSSVAPVLFTTFSGYSQSTAVVLKEVTHMTVTPTATAGSVATITVQLGSSGTPQTVASGTASSSIHMAPNADSSEPHTILVKVTAEDGVTTKTHTIKVWQYSPVSFGGATVSDVHFTAGHEAEHGPLPASTTDDYYEVTYTATGLPAGLSMGHDRIIRSTPAAAAAGPVTVTYTAEGEIGSSASLTFQVTVAPPVAFDADDFGSTNQITFDYTVGQAGFNETLPAATGGRGVLTYQLDDAPGFSFDPATRVLASDTGTNAPAAAAFHSLNYRAEDENGAQALSRIHIDVNEAPSLPAIDDKSLTAGEAATVTLPKASGGSLGEQPGLDYTLEPALSPEVEGLRFNGGTLVVSGTPKLPGSTAMTYTATDINGVSASETFTITVVNGPTAPTTAPSSLTTEQITFEPHSNGHGVIVAWGPVTGATAYVVQVIADGGSFPAKRVNSVPEPDMSLGFSRDDTREWVSVSPFSTGDYKARVAARNDDGVGPWSTEASFTVSPGGI